jgi:hypothetical protein
VQDQKERRQAFRAMLDEVEAEAERDGVYSVDDVLKEMDEIIRREAPRQLIG